MLRRNYRHVRLMGRDRPYRAPGRYIHALELKPDGSPYHPTMAVCGREPRYDSNGFESVAVPITCKRCLERLR